MGNDDGAPQSADHLADDFAQAMLRSPRGLRLAFTCFQNHLVKLMDGDYEGPVWEDHSAFFDACHDEDLAAGLSRRDPDERGWQGLPRRVGPGVREPAEPQMPDPLPYEQLAQRIRRYDPTPLTGPELLEALEVTVSQASYWGDVHGEEILAAQGPIRRALFPFAREAARAILAFGLDAASVPDAAWVVEFDNSAAGLPFGAPPAQDDAARLLEHWWDRTTAWESRMILELPTDPSTPHTGEWWSTPPSGLIVSCPAWPAAMTDPQHGPHPGEPTGLRLVEDPLGWKRARVYRLVSPRPPEELRLFVIDGPQDWAWLCARYPFEVSATKRHDWHRVTGAIEPWLIPDFDAMAAEFDAVHLTLRGYLSSAGIAIPVPRLLDPGEGPEVLDEELPARPPLGHSVIAGWAPLSTYWLVNARADPDSGTPWEGDGQREWWPASSSED
ncbi:hypothetical protein [Arthrobacter sp. RCC_34]|uniref:hypothetical protein n=1 Tax=Arthrobacter sp. RCC_34 TaxID=3239230 RepID=UPI003525F987